MGKRKPQERGGDQFGDWGGSQDREQHQGFGAGRGGGGAGGGGGTAGKRSVKGDLSFSKHVPKFLQPYAHMLGVKKQQDEEEPIIVGKQPQEEEDSDREDAGEVVSDRCIAWGAMAARPWGAPSRDWGPPPPLQEAIQRALADNPELAAQVGDTIVKKVGRWPAAAGLLAAATAWGAWPFTGSWLPRPAGCSPPCFRWRPLKKRRGETKPSRTRSTTKPSRASPGASSWIPSEGAAGCWLPFGLLQARTT